MATHPDIVFISCHGGVITEGHAVGNIMWKHCDGLNILTYIQQGTLQWGNEERCFDAETSLVDHRRAFNYNMSFNRDGKRFETDRLRQSTMMDESMQQRFPTNFCANLNNRFPNMWLGDFVSQEEKYEYDLHEAETPVSSPTSEYTHQIPTIKRGVTIVSGKTGQILLQLTITQIRNIIVNSPHAEEYMRHEMMSTLDGNSEWSVNLDQIVIFFLNTFYTTGLDDGNGNRIIGDSQNGINIYINTCIGANLVDTVLKNVDEGLTWPRRLLESVEIEKSNYNNIAHSCGRPDKIAATVAAAGEASQAALEYYRRHENSVSGGRKKIKNTKKKGKKKYSKKKRAKKQTKKRRMRKMSKK